MEVIIADSFKNFRPQLQAFAATYSGVRMAFKPGHFGRDGRTGAMQEGDWLHVEWTPREGVTYGHRIYDNPAKPDSVDIEDGLRLCAETFAYAVDRTKFENDLRVSEVGKAMAALAPGELERIQGLLDEFKAAAAA